MATAKLTVRLPKEEIELAKQYAQEHRVTVAEHLNRGCRGTRSAARFPWERWRLAGILKTLGRRPGLLAGGDDNCCRPPPRGTHKRCPYTEGQSIFSGVTEH